MKTFEEKYLPKIQELFQKYKGKMEKPELNEILDKGFVSSLPNMNAEILICGINPSLNEKDDRHFRFHALSGAHYFGTLHDIVRECENKTSIDYLDLFCFRHTDQKVIWQFTKDPVGIMFIAEHLQLTQLIIEEMKPKLILVFNKTAATFFGRDAMPEAQMIEDKNVWMGYKFSDIHLESPMNDNMYSVLVKSIVGLHEFRINSEMVESTLLNANIFFGSYMRYLKNEKKEELRKLIASLSKFE